MNYKKRDATTKINKQVKCQYCFKLYHDKHYLKKHYLDVHKHDENMGIVKNVMGSKNMNHAESMIIDIQQRSAHNIDLTTNVSHVTEKDFNTIDISIKTEPFSDDELLYNVDQGDELHFNDAVKSAGAINVTPVEHNGKLCSVETIDIVVKNEPDLTADFEPSGLVLNVPLDVDNVEDTFTCTNNSAVKDELVIFDDGDVAMKDELSDSDDNQMSRGSETLQNRKKSIRRKALLCDSSVAPAETILQCKFCRKSYTKSYTDTSGYKRHMLSHKTNHSSIQCDICEKSFTLTRLKAHRLTHCEFPQFKCDVCRKSFKDSSSLVKHKRSHRLHN